MRRIKRLLAGRRGSFLAHAMIFTVIVAIISAGAIKLSFGRRVMLNRVNSAEAARQRVLGAESYVHACVEDTSFGVSDCLLPAGCRPPALDGHIVVVTASGAPPDCELKFSTD